MLRRAAHLEGAIEAHRILMGKHADLYDNILYGMLDEGRMFPTGESGEEADEAS
jgi:hypothetical protein